MNPSGLIGFAVLWMIARTVGRMLRAGAPQARRAASTLREQAARQMAEGAEGRKPPQRAPVSVPAAETPLDVVDAAVSEDDPFVWDQQPFLSKEDKPVIPVKRPAVGRKRAPRNAKPAVSPLLGALTGDALVRGVILSEVLGPPKARRGR